MPRASTADRRDDEKPAQGRLAPWFIAGLFAVVAVELSRDRWVPAGRPIHPNSAASSNIVAHHSHHARIGLFATLRRLYRNVSDNRVFAVGAGVAFYSILAIFPAVAALVSLYGLFADTGTIESHLDSLAGLIPGGALDVIHEQMKRVLAQGNETLGLTFAAGILVSLWSANSGVKALFDALNVVYGELEKRSFITLNAISLLFTLGMIAFIMVALSGIILLPHVLQYAGLERFGTIIINTARWPVLFVVVALVLASIYRFGASRTAPRWRSISGGSAFAAIGWLAVSLLFSWYTANFGKYNETYGSLGAIIGFMTWMWLSAVVILVGGEVDAEMELRDESRAETGLPAPQRATHL